VHLAYELLGGAYDALVLVDAVDRGDEPGTVSLIEHRDAAAPAGGDGVLAAMDAHGMDPASVLAMLGDLGGSVGRVLVVGVQVAGIGEGMALSAAVAAAVPAAVEAVVEVVGSLVGETGLVAPPPAPRRAKEVR
jgi:hydrogenase maturation protease